LVGGCLYKQGYPPPFCLIQTIVVDGTGVKKHAFAFAKAKAST